MGSIENVKRMLEMERKKNPKEFARKNKAGKKYVIVNDRCPKSKK